ncbi:hypothetical protein HY493_02805 [Candidatus Woesearchaeota archaeon]|nr:hypothetical protein [Candidatus Woesearchaeota archaeon]
MSPKEESRIETKQQGSPCPQNATAKVIFTYAIEHLSKTDKVRFYYALKGRDGKTGIVKQWSIEQLGRAVLLVPESHENDVRDFLAFWKCAFNSRRVWLV